MALYIVCVQERWQRIVVVEANSPEEALVCAKDETSYSDDLDYVEDLPEETWKVYDKDGNLIR
jgi:hypothetical protein